MLSHIGHTILGMNSVQLYMKIPGCRTPGIYPFEHTLATSFLKKVMSSLQGKKKDYQVFFSASFRYSLIFALIWRVKAANILEIVVDLNWWKNNHLRSFQA